MGVTVRTDASPSVLDRFRLDGQVAIVTGAARGLGQAIALALASAGADLALVDIVPVAETAESVRQLGRRCHATMADLAALDPSAADAIVAGVEAALGLPQILVNNAGIIHR